MAKLVDKTYGDALFNLCMEENKIDKVMAQVDFLDQMFKENPELLDLLCHPQISKEEKIQVIADCFDARLDDALTGFLTVIVNGGRQRFIPEILKYFRERVKSFKHIGTAYVTTAAPLTKEQKQAVYNRLLEITDNLSYEMHFDVDTSLIGGMVIRIGDKVVDSSIRQKLETLPKRLL